MPTDNEFTRILQWPGYRVYQHVIDEKAKVLELWVRRKRGNRKLECSGCGRKFAEAHDISERAVRDLPWSEFRTTVHVEVYRVRCPQCGLKVERVPLLPSKAPFSKRFEESVGRRVRARRRVRWHDGRDFRRARYEPSTCGTWNDGKPSGGDHHYDRWGWTKSTGGSRGSFSR